MNFNFRDGKFDVVIAAGPRLENWPSVGVRMVSTLCADMGLSVGQFGGEYVTVRGIIPLPGTGGLVLVEDVQNRIHRIHARAIIRMSVDSSLPDPFPGWQSQGLIPLQTAERLRRESQIQWNPTTVILGTGNRALRFGTSLLESGVAEVFCVETFSQWGAKRFAGWEVERRRFESNGGKLLEAKPLQLIPKAPLLWQLRLQDAQGIRVLDVGRVVSAGPFENLHGVREYPPGSLLFEFDQTAAAALRDDVEGWAFEEERGRLLGGKIIKTLVTELGPKRDQLDPILRRARTRLKRYLRHREDPFTPAYQGKWLNVADSKRIRSFQGIPQTDHRNRLVASVECFEDIPCNLCQTACPTQAIQMGRTSRIKSQIFNEAACTACGLCVSACPSGAISMLREKLEESNSSLSLPWKGTKPWEVGEFTTLLNRRGESLGSARVSGVTSHEGFESFQMIQIELPTHLLWEARGVKRGRTVAASFEDAAFSKGGQFSHPFKNGVEKGPEKLPEKVEIILNGEKRLVRERIPVLVALFEIGKGRSEDILFCKDGSCGLCQISIDGINKLACQTRIHKGMSIKVENQKAVSPPVEALPNQTLCSCLEITREQVIERLKQGNLHSPEAVLSVTHVGEGKCHGQLCMDSFKRVLREQGLAVDQWIDWRFPWSDWILTHHSTSN